MTYPIPNLSRVWVRGRIIDLGKAATEQTKYGVGQSVTFSPSPKVLVNSVTKQIIASSSFKVAVSEDNGYFQILLPATNDPDVNPTNFTYAVKEPGTGRSYNITVPIETPTLNSPGDPLHGQPVIELSEIQPAPGASAGLVQLVSGRGLESIDIVSGDWVATFSDGGTQVIGEAPTGGGGVSTLSALSDVSTTGTSVGKEYTLDLVSTDQYELSEITKTRVEGWVSVKDFGAIGDGMTDDTEAFQTALAATPNDFDDVYSSVGGTVYVPPGRYRITDSLELGIGHRLIGAAARGSYEDSLYHGVGATLLADTPGMTLLSIDGGTGDPRQQGSELANLSLFDMSRTGGVEAKTCTLVRQYNVNRCTFRDITFHDAAYGYWGSPGVEDDVTAGDNSWNIWESCTFYNCTVGMGGNYGGTVTACDAVNCTTGYESGPYCSGLVYMGTKYDGTGTGYATEGYGVKYLGVQAELHSTGTGFAIDGDGDLSPSGEGNILVGCQVTGHGGVETGISVGSVARNTQIMGVRYSNLGVDVLDTGTGTYRVDASATVPPVAPTRQPTSVQPFRYAQFVSGAGNYTGDGLGASRAVGFDATAGLLIVAANTDLFTSNDHGWTLSAGKGMPSGLAGNPGLAVGRVLRFGSLWVLSLLDSNNNVSKVYTSPAPGHGGTCTWTLRLTQTGGTRPIFTSMDTDGTVIIVGDYGDPKVSGTNTAKIWRTTDGITWTTNWTGSSGVRHLHAVAADPYSPGHWYATFGDTSDPCLLKSTDYGASWSTVAALTSLHQSVQISFTRDHIWLAADVSHAPVWLLDRATQTVIKAGAVNDHRRIAIPIPGRHLLGQWDSGTTAIADYYDLPFDADSVGVRVTGPGIPAGATIVSVESIANATISANTTVANARGAYAFNIPEHFASECFTGVVDPDTGAYYFVSYSNSEGLPGSRIGLFYIPFAGGRVELLDVLPNNCDHIFIFDGYVYAGSMYRPLISFA